MIWHTASETEGRGSNPASSFRNLCAKFKLKFSKGFSVKVNNVMKPAYNMQSNL